MTAMLIPTSTVAGSTQKQTEVVITVTSFRMKGTMYLDQKCNLYQKCNFTVKKTKCTFCGYRLCVTHVYLLGIKYRSSEEQRPTVKVLQQLLEQSNPGPHREAATPSATSLSMDVRRDVIASRSCGLYAFLTRLSAALLYSCAECASTLQELVERQPSNVPSNPTQFPFWIQRELICMS